MKKENKIWLSTNDLDLGFIEAVRCKRATTLLDEPGASTCPARGGAEAALVHTLQKD